MKNLIERLERATGPDRDLDIAIGEAVGAADHGWPAYHRPFKDWAKHYTASIDAALTLVPEGFRWKLGYSKNVPCVASVVDYRIQMAPNVGSFDAECDSNHAIALCVAALRAREETAHSGG